MAAGIDTLVEMAAVAGYVAAGAPVAWLLANHDVRMVVTAPPSPLRGSPRSRRRKPPAWSTEEESFLRRNLGWLSEEEIGAKLGRSVLAVHLRWSRDLRLPAPSKRPDEYTGQQVADALGMDVHPVCRWIDAGILPGRVLPGGRRIRVVRRVTLYRWAVTPRNWIYFKPWQGKVREWRLARLVGLAMERWEDAWWTPGQVAAYHGVDHTDVNRLIHQGKIRGAQYGNWWILRSEATRPDLKFYKGKGAGHELEWNPEADRFLLRAWRERTPLEAIARAMGMPCNRVRHRLDTLRRIRQ